MNFRDDSSTFLVRIFYLSFRRAGLPVSGLEKKSGETVNDADNDKYRESFQVPRAVFISPEHGQDAFLDVYQQGTVVEKYTIAPTGCFSLNGDGLYLLT
jgi:hypothetical protein